MRESLGSTKPEGGMKVKVCPLRWTRVGSRALASGRTTGPSGCSTTVAPGGARAYTLGPERW